MDKCFVRTAVIPIVRRFNLAEGKHMYYHLLLRPSLFSKKRPCKHPAYKTSFE